jgi:hypothetical protein
MQILSKESDMTGFEYDLADLNEPLKSLSDKVVLRIESKYLDIFLSGLDWSAIMEH